MKLLYAIGTNSGSVRNGLRLVSIDDETGRFHEIASVPDAECPIYFARSADRRHLYAAERRDGQGCVSVYRIEGTDLRRVQCLPCAPTAPCHIALSPDGRFLAWAEYLNARAGVFAVQPDGTLRGPTGEVRHEGHGPNAARQASAHCHQALFSPEGDGIFVCDLGTDSVVSYRVAPDGSLATPAASVFRAPPGSGLRHLLHHPSRLWTYLVSELASTVTLLRRDGLVLTPAADPLPMLPEGFDGATKAAAIRLSPDGSLLAASNRGHDSLAFFRVAADTGLLSPLSIAPLAGRFPRDFVFLPNGRFLLVAHKLDHEFASYALDADAGTIRLVQRSTPLTLPLAFERI